MSATVSIVPTQWWRAGGVAWFQEELRISSHRGHSELPPRTRMIAGGSDTKEKYHDPSRQNPFPRLGVPKSCQHPPVAHPTTATSLLVCREPGCRERPGFITVSACGNRAVIGAPAGRGYRGTLNHRLFPPQYPILAALVLVKIINN